MSDTERGSEQETIIGGRNVVAFVELGERYSNEILSVTPIPEDGAEGWAFGDTSTHSVHVWGVESTRGERIADAYERGDLPTEDTEELNRILRPDEFDE